MHQLNFLPVILILLFAAVIVVAIFKHLKMSPVLGYFFAGSILGSPLISSVSKEDTEVFGEFGIIFLLFAIGLELTFARLKSMRTQVFGFGTLQILITTVIIATITLFSYPKISQAVVIGMALALSSTAIVLQVIAENRMQSTQVGRLSIAILLMQDFAVVPLLVLMPMTATNTYDIVKALGWSVGKATIALVGIFIAGRLFFRPLYRMISSDNAAKSNEIFIAATLFIALSAAWTTEQLGLSLALGAFFAGLLVAETEFQHQAEESIAPFKGLFLGLFFMTVGMSINLELIITNLPKILLITSALIFIKFIVVFVLSLLFKFSVGSAIHAGLLLAQGGEFAFILFNLGAHQKIISQDIAEILMLVITFTMALTPLLSSIGRWLAEKIDKKDIINKKTILKEISDIDKHVIICGFGRVGKMVARLLEAEHITYVAVDLDAKCVSDSRDEGFPVYFGDTSDVEILKVLGIDRAQAAIISITNDVTKRKAVKTIKQANADVPIVLRDNDLSEQEFWFSIGVSNVVPETYETGLQLGGAVLKSVGISEFEVSRIKNKFRAGNYIYAKTIEDSISSDEEDSQPVQGKIPLD